MTNFSRLLKDNMDYEECVKLLKKDSVNKVESTAAYQHCISSNAANKCELVVLLHAQHLRNKYKCKLIDTLHSKLVILKKQRIEKSQSLVHIHDKLNQSLETALDRKNRIIDKRTDLKGFENELRHLRSNLVCQTVEIFTVKNYLSDIKIAHENSTSLLKLMNISHFLFVVAKIFDIEMPFKIFPKNILSYVEDNLTSSSKKIIEICAKREYNPGETGIVAYLELNIIQINQIMGIGHGGTEVWGCIDRIYKGYAKKAGIPLLEINNKRLYNKLDSSLKSNSINVSRS
ncbi:hypothetical protein HZS_2896, partial [Henneguya salminicola]